MTCCPKRSEAPALALKTAAYAEWFRSKATDACGIRARRTGRALRAEGRAARDALARGARREPRALREGKRMLAAFMHFVLPNV